ELRRCSVRRQFDAPADGGADLKPPRIHAHWRLSRRLCKSPAHPLSRGLAQFRAPQPTEITTMTEVSRPMDGRAEIEAMLREHQALVETVRAMESQPSPDQLQIVRVKKRKLALRDRLLELENRITPDLIA
ncbi:MAG TPA: DUF465 domain-containing protein, partial [Caulobacteraceae bacterium]